MEPTPNSAVELVDELLDALEQAAAEAPTNNFDELVRRPFTSARCWPRGRS